MTSRVPLDVLTIGDGGDLADPEGQFRSTYGVEDGGAVLVRPDGYVAWRSRDRVADPTEALHAALASMLGTRDSRQED